jgi:hypothetical protein
MFVLAGHVLCGQVRSGLSPGGEWIRTFGSAILIMLLKTVLSETDQCTIEHGVGRVPAYRTLWSRQP